MLNYLKELYNLKVSKYEQFSESKYQRGNLSKTVADIIQLRQIFEKKHSMHLHK